MQRRPWIKRRRIKMKGLPNKKLEFMNKKCYEYQKKERMKEMFILPAYAQTAATSAPGDGLGTIIVQFVILMGILYLLLIRPQQKKVKKQIARLQAIQVGDEVLVSGILGKVVDAKEDELTVRIAKETDIKVMRLYVTDVLNKKESDKKGK